MNKLPIRALSAALLCGLILVSVVLAQTSTDYDLTWHVVGSGGKAMASTAYAMEGTFGQVVIGRTESMQYALCEGYWYPYPSNLYTVFIPLVLRSHP